MILHLSDLHLTDRSDDEDYGDFKSETIPKEDRIKRQDVLINTLKALATSGERRLDSVVISGDITYQNRREGYEQLEKVLSALGPLRPEDPKRTCIVPGNHDVAWGEGDASKKYALFLEFVRSKGYTTPPLEDIDLRTENSAADLSANIDSYYVLDPSHRWAIVPINSSHYCGSVAPISPISDAVWNRIPESVGSSQRENAKQALRKLRSWDMPRVSPKQMHAIHEIVRRIRSVVGDNRPAPMIIGAMHHQLLPVSEIEENKAFESLINLGHFRYVLRDNGFACILHGHKHTDNIYFDYIHKLVNSDADSPHRVCVISAPALKIAGSNEAVFRILTPSTKDFESILRVRDVRGVQPGFALQKQEERVFRIWQAIDSPSLRVSRFNCVEGTSMNEVYEKAMSLFETATDHQPLPNLTCRVASPPSPDKFDLPITYPEIPGHSGAGRNLWFSELVNWWQKDDFKKLSLESVFNHGTRIFAYERQRFGIKDEERCVNQLRRAASALQQQPTTSRAVITLLKPHRENIETADFPSFCFIQCLLRQSDSDLYLDVVAYFRKQEICYWWPVNLYELSIIQKKIADLLPSTIQRKTVKIGAITTIAAIAVKENNIPGILVPAVDQEFEQNPQKLWNMIYSVCWPEIQNREAYAVEWEHLLKRLVPKEKVEPSGAFVPHDGIEYLKDLSQRFAEHHEGPIKDMAELWDTLLERNTSHSRELKTSNRENRQAMHEKWRIAVIKILNQIRIVVEKAFSVEVDEFE
jgi:3',5'-cyclic AMP phosphodiesterase CpdA